MVGREKAGNGSSQSQNPSASSPGEVGSRHFAGSPRGAGGASRRSQTASALIDTPSPSSRTQTFYRSTSSKHHTRKNLFPSRESGVMEAEPLMDSQPKSLLADVLSSSRRRSDDWYSRKLAQKSSESMGDVKTSRGVRTSKILPPKDGDGIGKGSAEGESSKQTCELHGLPVVSICERCPWPFLCVNCVSEHSRLHDLKPASEFDKAFSVVVDAAKEGLKTFEDSLNGIQEMIKLVDAAAEAASSEIRAASEVTSNMLKARESALTDELEKIRDSKLDILGGQLGKLNHHLSIASDVLKKADLVSNDPNSNDAVLHSTFTSLLDLLTMPQPHLLPTEDEFITFRSSVERIGAEFTQVSAIEGDACAKSSYLLGSGSKVAIMRKKCVAYVQLMDASGAVGTCSEQSLTAVLSTYHSKVLHVTITPQKRGLVALSFLPEEEGLHYLDVKIRGNSIKEFPVEVYVRRTRDYSFLARRGPSFTFGEFGTEDGQFLKPWGVCLNSAEDVIVTDRERHCVQIFNKSGAFLMKFGSEGAEEGQFDRPSGVTTNSRDEIIVADKNNHRVQIFTSEGEFKLSFGSRGYREGCFVHPWAVTVNSIDHIAVSDIRDHHVQIFSPYGERLRAISVSSSVSMGVEGVDDETDNVAPRPQRDVELTVRDALLEGTVGSLGEGFHRSFGLAYDFDGKSLICDSHKGVIWVFDEHLGRAVEVLGMLEAKTPMFDKRAKWVGGKDRKTLAAMQLLMSPTDIAVSRLGSIYVVDSGNACIRLF